MEEKPTDLKATFPGLPEPHSIWHLKLSLMSHGELTVEARTIGVSSVWGGIGKIGFFDLFVFSGKHVQGKYVFSFKRISELLS